MKLNPFLLILFPFSSSIYLQDRLDDEISEISSISTALTDIANEFFLGQSIKLQVRYITQTSLKTTDVMTRFMSNSKDILDVRKFHLITGHKFPVLGCYFLFLNNINDFQLAIQFLANFRYSDDPMMEMVYFGDLTMEEFTRSELFQQYSTLNIMASGLFMTGFFIFNHQDSLTLATVEWVNEMSCDQAHLKVLNRFDKKSQKWRRKLEFYEKFLDYFGCELVMMIPVPTEKNLIEHTSGYIEVLGIDETGIHGFKLHGITPKVFESASKVGNYTPSYQPVSIPSSFFRLGGEVLEVPVNGIVKATVHVYFEMLPSYQWDSRFKTSHSFVDLENYFVATPAEAYSAYERLALPFDIATWILLWVTFTVTFVAILVINRLNVRVRNVVYGEKINNPFWNVISIVFGISQTRLPKENFSRLILVLFIGFCLIFRTCFQSKMFEFMTSEPRRSPPKTFSDLIDRKYDNYFDTIGYPDFEDVMDEFGRSLILKSLSPAETKDIFTTQSQNDTAHLALLVDDFFIQYYMNLSKKDYNWNRLDEKLYVSHEALGFKQFSFYYRMFKKVADRLIDTGIMSYLAENFYTRKLKFGKVADHPRVLSLKELAFGFNIHIGCCVVALTALIAEKVVDHLKSIRKPKKIKYAKVHPAVVTESGPRRLKRDREVYRRFRVSENRIKCIAKGAGA